MITIVAAVAMLGFVACMAVVGGAVVWVAVKVKGGRK